MQNSCKTCLKRITAYTADQFSTKCLPFQSQAVSSKGEADLQFSGSGPAQQENMWIFLSNKAIESKPVKLQTGCRVNVLCLNVRFSKKCYKFKILTENCFRPTS